MQSLMGAASRRVLRCFIAGILAILPLAITVAVVTWVGSFVAQFLGPSTVLGRLLRRLGVSFVTDERAAYAIGALLILALIFLLGVVVEAGAKSWIQGLLDAIIRRIPLIGKVYDTSRQLVGLMDKQGDADLQGMQPVFCHFGGPGGAGFLALLVSPQRFLIGGRPCVIVIVPTAPVPVGGGMLFLPAESVQPVDVSVEGLMSIYVSMGVTAPQFLPAVAADSSASSA